MSHLPTEILASVISQGFAEEADLVFLWTVLRNVDRRFRALVDSYVRKNHLKRTYITYRIPDSIGPGPSTNVEIWLRSAGVDPQDLATAIFVYDDVMSTLPGDVLGGFGAIREELRQHPLDDWLCPAHVLSVGRYVNDTELCGFEVVDCSREGERTGGFEVRIDWRMTFTRLLFEEKGRQGMSRRWVSQTLCLCYSALCMHWKLSLGLQRLLIDTATPSHIPLNWHAC